MYATQIGLVVGLATVYCFAGWPKFKSRDRRVCCLLVAILLISLVSARLASQSVPALAGVIDLTGASLAFVAMLDRRVKLRTVMLAFIFGLIIPVVVGLAQVVFGESGASSLLGLATRDADTLGDTVIMLADGTRVLRAYGTFPHPNIFGGYLAIGILTCLSVSFGTIRWLTPRVYIGLLGWLGLGLLLTASRSAVFGFLLGGGLVWLTARMSRVMPRPLLALQPMLALVAIVLVLATSVMAPAVVTGLRGGGELEQRSLDERVEQYREFPSTLSGTTWLFGNGPRNYVFALAEAHPARSAWEYQPIHNAFLLLLSELGLLGIIAVLAWLVTLCRFSSIGWPKRESLFIQAMAITLLTIGVFDHYLWSTWAGLVLVAYVGALAIRLDQDVSGQTGLDPAPALALCLREC